MRKQKLAIRTSFVLLGFLVLCAGWASGETVAHIDHIILGAADLDRAVDTFERLTGVRPVYGGKHPGGTHNALVSLGDHTYLELIAVQPGTPPPPYLPDLSSFKDPMPIGWAVSASDSNVLRDRLSSAGFSLTAPQAGSRVTPGGQTLRWETFFLAQQLNEGPFFIIWASDSPHPSTTSPSGCKLDRWQISGPDSDKLERLRKALNLPLETGHSQTIAFSLTLACPKGDILLQSSPQR